MLLIIVYVLSLGVIYHHYIAFISLKNSLTLERSSDNTHNTILLQRIGQIN